MRDSIASVSLLLLLLLQKHNLKKLTSVIKVCGVQHVLISCHNASRVKLEVWTRGDWVQKNQNKTKKQQR